MNPKLEMISAEYQQNLSGSTATDKQQTNSGLIRLPIKPFSK